MSGLVKPQHVYFDRKSVNFNGAINEKYKIAGYPTPLKGISPSRLFWILTKNKSAYPQRKTVVIEQCHWENKDPRSLIEPFGYLCADFREELSRRNIISKMRDRSNGFREVARLCDDKFEEFRLTLHKVTLGPGMTIPDMKKTAASTVTKLGIEKLLKELHL